MERRGKVKKVGEAREKQKAAERERETVGGGIQRHTEIKRGREVSWAEASGAIKIRWKLLLLFVFVPVSCALYRLSLLRALGAAGQCWRKTSFLWSHTYVMEEASASSWSSVSLRPLSFSSHSCTVASFPPLRPSVEVAQKSTMSFHASR